MRVPPKIGRLTIYGGELTGMVLSDPRHEKTCLQDLRPGKSNWPAQL